MILTYGLSQNDPRCVATRVQTQDLEDSSSRRVHGFNQTDWPWIKAEESMKVHCQGKIRKRTWGACRLGWREERTVWKPRKEKRERRERQGPRKEVLVKSCFENRLAAEKKMKGKSSIRERVRETSGKGIGTLAGGGATRENRFKLGQWPGF